ncbi:MAG TPA: hypothetical protein VF159_11335 [Gemmatimonadaceae bacterium]
MRTIRALAAAAAVATMAPALAGAQQGRPFKDAWFWGIKGGGMTYANAAGNTQQAPVGGVDWLITRTRGGLYVAGSQAFFSGQAFVADNPNTPDSRTRRVNVSDVRHLDMAVMGFPGTHVFFHPYAGFGMTLSQVGSAVAPGPYSLPADSGTAAQNIQDGRVSFSPLLLVGGQWRFRLASVFVQGTASPTQKDFLLYNGNAMTWGYEVGVRYNIGSSIDKE